MYRFVPQWFVVFYWNFNNSYSTVADCTYYIYKLDGEFGEILPNDLKGAVNCLFTMYANGDFSMSMVGWMEIIEISIISRSSFNDFDQINGGRITFWSIDLFYRIFDKIYQSVTCNSYITSIIEPISTDSPPNDKWGLGVFDMLVCRMYRLYSTNLVCLANERFW